LQWHVTGKVERMSDESLDEVDKLVKTVDVSGRCA
jgi:hypothetical protein